jgi:hypothetical protein
MSDKKPNVFPTKEQMDAANNPAPQPEEQQAPMQPQVNPAEAAAAEEMKRRTEEQLRLRDEAAAKNLEMAEKMHNERDEAMNRQTAPVQPPVTPPPTYNDNGGYGNPAPTPDPTNIYIQQLSQPDYDSPYDVIPLPSEGKIYKNGKKSIKVSFLNTSDENILSSPNLLESGQFLEILINRKILEPDLRYEDLLVGDRNAIMIWLRATGYGEMYPIALLDEENNMFETEVNLGVLKTKNLGAEPDSEGLFDFLLPLAKKNIKFRLLTVKDIDEIEDIVEKEIEGGALVNNAGTYTLQRQIVEVNGDRNPEMISNFAKTLRVFDSNELKDYIDKIESGIDLNIDVETPGGGSINTFLPLSLKFFWPNL